MEVWMLLVLLAVCAVQSDGYRWGEMGWLGWVDINGDVWMRMCKKGTCEGASIDSKYEREEMESTDIREKSSGGLGEDLDFLNHHTHQHFLTHIPLQPKTRLHLHYPQQPHTHSLLHYPQQPHTHQLLHYPQRQHSHINLFQPSHDSLKFVGGDVYDSNYGSDYRGGYDGSYRSGYKNGGAYNDGGYVIGYRGHKSGYDEQNEEIDKHPVYPRFGSSHATDSFMRNLQNPIQYESSSSLRQKSKVLENPEAFDTHQLSEPRTFPYHVEHGDYDGGYLDVGYNDGGNYNGVGYNGGSYIGVGGYRNGDYVSGNGIGYGGYEDGYGRQNRKIYKYSVLPRFSRHTTDNFVSKLQNIVQHARSRAGVRKVK